ncbi:MAG: ribonuclease H-like domain-containing protein [Dehalococcoidales bacterium]|nr:ribonuclease H-like domain-containing protein [Dehalococcoidales bacterium]
MFDAYLDIETTGLSSWNSEITVIGIYLVKSRESRMLQLTGRDVTAYNLREALDGVKTIYTYNGSRFDLPFIYSTLGVDVEKAIHHTDLMYDCWRCKLKGGLKSVEEQLGIPRKLKGITGWDAVRLWYQYQENDDRDALNTLLEYNKEDVMNLKVLREKLRTAPR